MSRASKALGLTYTTVGTVRNMLQIGACMQYVKYNKKSGFPVKST